MKMALSQVKPFSEEAIIESNDFARLSVRAASEMKAEELVVLDVRELASYCDYFVLCNGTNARQVRAIAQSVLDLIKKRRGSPPKAEGMEAARWVLVDLGDVLLHVFDGPMRGYYDLDALWIDARRVPLSEFGLNEDGLPLEGTELEPKSSSEGASTNVDERAS
jgi:ribosome-associated protein